MAAVAPTPSSSPLGVGQVNSGDCDENAPKGPQKNEIPTTTAQLLLKKGAVFVDIRAPKDFAKSHIRGAVNLPLNKLSDGVATLPKDKPVVVYESRHHLVGDRVDSLALLPGEFFDEVLGQQWDVASPFP